MKLKMTDNFKKTTKLFTLPMALLIERAHQIHKRHFPGFKLQASSLLSVKTGGCSEDCAYCPQSAHYKTNIEKHKMLDQNVILEYATNAKKMGATRFCLGASWKKIVDGPDFESILSSIRKIKKIGLETCCTLGELNSNQANKLKSAGLDFYNHNIDTSPDYYPNIVSTHTFDDRLNTLNVIKKANIKICTGGILGLGESDLDRIKFITTIANLSPQPQSISINKLIQIKGTPLESATTISDFEIIRVIATLRILCPESFIRLSAGRERLSESAQFLCFYAGANSIFIGNKLLTASNPNILNDNYLLKKTGYEFIKN